MRTNSFFIIISIYLLSLNSYGQAIKLNLGQAFNDYKDFELRLNSSILEEKSLHMLSQEMAQPIKFLRVNDSFNPKLIVQYFFKKTDSTVQEVLYEWDKVNFNPSDYKTTENDVESNERFDEFVHKYTSLRNEITTVLGNSTAEGSLKSKADLPYLDMTMKDSWENDSLSVLMYVTFSNHYEVIGNMTITPTHKIRVYVSSKNKVHGELSEQLKTVFKVDEKQQKIAEKYISLLVAEKYKDSWRLISPLVKSKTTYNSYLQAVKTIEGFKSEFGNNTELNLSGPKFINNGVYYFYSFKFSNDKSNPPSVFLDVTFKLGDEQIIGFQPKKLNMQRIK